MIARRIAPELRSVRVVAEDDRERRDEDDRSANVDENSQRIGGEVTDRRHLADRASGGGRLRRPFVELARVAAADEGGDGPDPLARRFLVPRVPNHRARHPDLLSDEQ